MLEAVVCVAEAAAATVPASCSTTSFLTHFSTTAFANCAVAARQAADERRQAARVQELLDYIDVLLNGEPFN